MGVLRKIVRNGSSMQVTLSRPQLEQLRWRPGDYVIVEVIDVDRVQIRPARGNDLRSPGEPKRVDDEPRSVPA